MPNEPRDGLGPRRPENEKQIFRTLTRRRAPQTGSIPGTHRVRLSATGGNAAGRPGTSVLTAEGREEASVSGRGGRPRGRARLSRQVSARRPNPQQVNLPRQEREQGLETREETTWQAAGRRQPGPSCHLGHDCSSEQQQLTVTSILRVETGCQTRPMKDHPRTLSGPTSRARQDHCEVNMKPV